MENLLKELSAPRLISPGQAQLRAVEVIKKLLDTRQQDLAARQNAERLLAEAHADIERLTKELNDAKETISKLTASTSDTTG